MSVTEDYPTDKDKWYTASLRIYSETLSIEEMNQRLGYAPSESYEKGSLYSQRTLQGSKRKESLWMMKSDLEAVQPLELHLEQLLAFIEMKKEPLEGLLAYCEMDLFCGFSSLSGQGSLTLSSSVLKRLSAFPIDLVLDLYPPDGDENSR